MIHSLAILKANDFPRFHFFVIWELRKIILRFIPSGNTEKNNIAEKENIPDDDGMVISPIQSTCSMASVSQ